MAMEAAKDTQENLAPALKRSALGLERCLYQTPQSKVLKMLTEHNIYLFQDHIQEQRNSKYYL